MMAIDDHPAPELLSDYALGRLLEADLDAIAEHVERCTNCQDTLSQLKFPDDTLVRGLAGASPETPFGDEPEFDLALQAIRRVGAEADPGATRNLGQLPDLSSSSDGFLGTLRDYELLALLGQGGMGTVYRARHLRLDRLVAVKVLPAERMRQSQAIARFHREMKAVGNLDHPNIVRAFDAGEVEGKHYLAMELVDGVDLSALVEREGPLAVADACELVRQAAVGLEHAHRNGLVHRDVKPSNLMLDRRGVVKVLDLGLARLLSEPVSTDDVLPEGEVLLATESGGHFQAIGPELTGANQVMGTPDYMAPEQCTDSRAVDARSDVYSLGATLYRLLAGQAPYSGTKYETLAKKITGLAKDPVPPITEHRRDLPSGLIALVSRMLARQPQDRPATPALVAEALAPFCSGHQVLRLASDDANASGPAAGSVPPRTVRRRALALGAAGAIVAICLVLARIATPDGELVVEVAPEIRDAVHVEVSHGKEVRVLSNDPKHGWSISLDEGTWDVRLKDPNDQFEIDSHSVEIKRGVRRLVHVSLRPKVDAKAGGNESTTAAASDAVKTPSDASAAVAAQPRRYLGETDAQRLSEIVVLNPANGHYYMRGRDPMSWHAAQHWCEAQGGHLAAIASAEENDFVYKHFAREQVCWLGATDEVDEGVWTWVGGEPFDYKNWFRDEPSSSDGEDYLAIGSRVVNWGGIHYRYDAYWNDLPDDGKQHGYEIALPLCEWEPGRAPAEVVQRAREMDEPIQRVVAQFNPPTDSPIAKDGVTQVAGQGEPAWEFSTDKTRTFQLFEIENPSVDDCILVYQASMMTENVVGQAYLEMTCRVPGGGESVSKGFHHAAKGTNDWASYETPFFLQAGQRPDLVRLNLVVEGQGTVRIRDVKLLVNPLPDAMKKADGNPERLPLSPPRP